MIPLSDLIARLEAAKEGSRELDGLVAIEVTQISDLVNPQLARERISATAPRYTTSLDAALTLVPDGWMYQLLKTGGVLIMSGKPHSASIKAPSEYGWVDPPRPHDGYADTMALALCIAALKAREAAR